MQTSNKLITGFLLVILLTITTILIGAKIFSKSNFIEASGNLKSEFREVGSFHGIDVSSGIEVYLQQTEEEKVEVNADENILPSVSTFVEDGILKIRKEGKIRIRERIQVHVSVVDISMLKFASGAKVETLSNIKGKNLTMSGSSGAIGHLNLDFNDIKLTTSSGAMVSLEGTVQNMNLSSSSGSNVNAGALMAANYEVEASSGSMVEINVQDVLSASVSSGAHIRYKGEPEVKKAATSSGGRLTH